MVNLIVPLEESVKSTNTLLLVMKGTDIRLDARCQFHQHCASNSFALKSYSLFSVFSLCLYFFGKKEIGEKTDYKMLVNLTNFTNILWAAFALISFCQKNTNLTVSRKSCKKHFHTEKLFVKCWWNWLYSLQQMLREMVALFGEDMWKHVVIGVSFWSFSEKDVIDRNTYALFKHFTSIMPCC